MKRIAGIYKNVKQNNVITNFLNLGSIQVSNMALAMLAMFVVTRTVGILAFGLVTTSYRFALLAGTGINWGTGQSGVRDTALSKSDANKLSIVFFNTLSLRLLAFALFILALFILQAAGLFYSRFVMFSLPVVFAEVVNPLCFFIGVEKLKIFNVYNLIGNAVTLIIIVLTVHGADDALWVNFILGTANVITYIVLLIHFVFRHQLQFTVPAKPALQKMAKDNFYLTVNNASANLQQSVIIFALSKWSTPGILGAYAISDRFIGQIRNMLNIVGNSIYPKAVHLYAEGETFWIVYRQKVKKVFMAIFFVGAVLVFLLADLIVFILSKQHDATAVLIMRTMACVPIISVLNTINTLDQLIKKHNVFIFRIATLLLAISTVTAIILAQSSSIILIGAFTIIVELSSCLMYEYIITKPSHLHE